MSKMNLKCATHGSQEWSGTICCVKCKRAFQTEDEKAPFYAPRVCPCGAQLMPPPGRRFFKAQSTPAFFTARAICPHCFVSLTTPTTSGNEPGSA